MLIDQDTLLEVSGLKRPGVLKRHLRAQGIPYKILGGRVVTTTDAFNGSLRNGKKKANGPNFGALDEQSI